MRCDVAVIGGGIGGLTVGALLAGRGLKVSLFEKNSDIGGRVAVNWFRGASVDYGPHIFWTVDLEWKIGWILKSLGQKIDWLELDPLLLHKDGASIKLDVKFFRSLAAFFRGKGSFNVPKQFLTKEDLKEVVPIVLELVNLKETQIEELDSISLGKWLRKRTSNENVLEAFRCIATVPLTIDDLDLLSAGEFVRSAQTFFKARRLTCYPKNGINDIIGNLANAIRKRDGGVFTDYGVEEIKIEKGKVKGLVARDIENNKAVDVKAKIVIYNGLVHEIFDIADKKSFSKDEKKKIESMKGKVTSGLSVIAGLKNPLFSYNGPMLYHNKGHMRYLLCPSNILEACNQPCKPYIFYGHYVEPSFLENKKKVLKNSELLLEEFSGLYPRFKKEAKWIATGTIKTIDGLARKPGLTGKFKQDVESSIKGLFFVGDSVRGSGNGTSAAVDSARICFDRIMTKREQLLGA